ncbi:MAG: nucleotidyltransferase domain-containing protein [Desulfobacterales bacterium]|nr:nucleotidyltransferase domain-containing protein [Desulfobacterales bacterium]
MKKASLTPERLRDLLAAFKERHGKQYSLHALGYFGSYAKGSSTQASDVDILFDTDAPNLFMTAMMKQDLEELLGCPVDVVQVRGLTNQRLKERIEKEAVYV